MSKTPEQRLKELGIKLPAPCQPAGNYRPALIDGNYLYVSGHTPDDARAEGFAVGKVGGWLSVEEGYAGARDVGLAILSTVKAALGSLNRVERLIKATGMVNCALDFGSHPKVMNGFSDLMAEVFGAEHGVGTRSATGAASLPGTVAVEVTEAIFKIKPARKAKRKQSAKKR